MIESIKIFLKELAGGTAQQRRFEESDYRVAAAALLIHLIGSDGAIVPSERERLHGVIRRRFALDDAAAKKLIEEAVEAEGEAVDLYRFTSLLNRSLDEDGRRRVIEMMWELVFADGRVDEFEDNVIWRVADLLHVPSRERIALRREVEQEAEQEPAVPTAAADRS
jgi:uncharacterized tellurite resistance protein B-like protein